MDTTTKVKCAICGHNEHILVAHITRKHSMTPVEYLDAYPGSSLWSSYGLAKIREMNRTKAADVARRPRKTVPIASLFDFGKEADYEVTGDYEIYETPGPLTPSRDPHYIFPEEQTLDMLAILEKTQRNRVYIKGWSGTGKTQLAFNLAAVINAEVMEWNADAFQQRSSLIGQWTVRDGGTVWEYGILPKAMMRGCWLVINEIDTIDPHTLNVLKPVLEDPPRLTILENGGEVITAHPDFRIIATANTWARGDASGMFINTHVQSDADARRWSARILLDYLDPAVEEKMLKGYFPKVSDKTISQFVQVASRVRDAFKAGKIDKTFSPAELINWCENYTVLGRGVHHAARLSFLNALEPDVQTAIDEMITLVFGQSDAPA